MLRIRVISKKKLDRGTFLWKIKTKGNAVRLYNVLRETIAKIRKVVISVVRKFNRK